ncbi:MAG: MFS transporter [Chloroflexi bacterium]|nr:MFS transporter [Chloroflexota bacterium]
MSLLHNRSLIGATLGHFSVDLYSGMLPVLLLLLTDQLGLTYTQVGIASMTYSLTSSLSQPFFGWLGDHRGARVLAILGVAGSATSVGIMRFVDQYAIVLILAALAGLGSAAFHPQGAKLAAQAPAEQRGSAASIFMLGGNTGYAFGPLAMTASVALAGGRLGETLGVFGLGQCVLLTWILISSRSRSEHSSSPAGASATHAAFGVVVTLGLVIFLRSWIQTSITTYIPQIYRAQGMTTDAASAILFAILLPLALGGLLGGSLSDRIGRRRVLVVSTGLIGPALWGLMHATGWATFVWAPLLGVAIGASLPVTLVMAQSLAPSGLGLASGIVLGFTFVAGAIGVGVNGFIADQAGLLPTMGWNAVMPMAASALACFLPRDRLDDRRG